MAAAAAAHASPLRAEEWRDPLWRLTHLYHIVDDDGRDLKFVPNEEQLEFYHSMWWLNVILKARQLGFTTFIDLMALDQCIFNENFQAAVICHNLDDAKKIFRRKILHPWRRLPQAIRDACPLAKETDSELVWKNGSSISVTTSARSGTFQFLHVSELGKIARRFPEKAREIVTGSFEAVPIGKGMIFVESTAEGNAGRFYDMVMSAMRLQQAKKKLTTLDFKLHFFPWWRKRSNVMDPAGVIIDSETKEYFATLELKHGITLTREQKAWYAKKVQTLQDDMRREHPSYPEEAFQQAVDGAIFATQMKILRRSHRIGLVEPKPGIAVNTFWDLGQGDATGIWLHQLSGGTDRFIKFMGASGHGLRHWRDELEDWREEQRTKGVKLRWGVHHLPHDGKHKLQLAEVQSRIDILQELEPEWEIVGVPRITDKDTAIQLTRQKMVGCYIDEEACADGIKALDNYQYEWIEASGTWSRNPLHNWCSNPADAFMQWAQGYSPEGPPPVARAAEANAYRGGY